ncbi:MAG TPA: DUF2059 domain-containing protein [Candidatus Solibacter sp.]|nr:DUF2059 domain-containing protein [Candidatus Solibacter sp.]
MRRLLGLALFLGLVAIGSLPAQLAGDDAPATKEDVQQLFATMHIREMMRNLMETITKQQRQMIHDALRKKVPDISQKDLDRIEEMSNQIFKDLDMDGMVDDMIPVYQRHLTKVDVAAMSAFYQTPTGQKMLREQPQMTAEAMQAVQPRMEKMMGRAMDQAEKMAKDMAAESQSSGSKTKD